MPPIPRSPPPSPVLLTFCFPLRLEADQLRPAAAARRGEDARDGGTGLGRRERGRSKWRPLPLAEGGLGQEHWGRARRRNRARHIAVTDTASAVDTAAAHEPICEGAFGSSKSYMYNLDFVPLQRVRFGAILTSPIRYAGRVIVSYSVALRTGAITTAQSAGCIHAHARPFNVLVQFSAFFAPEIHQSECRTCVLSGHVRGIPTLPTCVATTPPMFSQ